MFTQERHLLTFQLGGGVGVVLIRAWVHIQGNKVTLGELKCHLISNNAMLLINLLYVVCVFWFLLLFC